MKIACVAIVKNEQNHIAEWIAYQLALGFDTIFVFDNRSTDTIFVFDNRSTDATAARIRAFAPMHDVRLLDWPMTTPDYQTRCYEHAARTYADEFDWIAFFDVDEFLVLDTGFDLKSILNLWAEVPAIGVPWAMFGSSGHIDRPDALLIEAFTHRAEPSFGPNRHIKSIIRPQRMLYCHNAHSFAMDGQYRSLSGKPLTFTQGGLLDSDPDYTLGKLHHYFTRSRAHWADKMQRGYHDTTRETTEFELYDRNEIHDDSAARHAPRVREILANLTLPAPEPHPVIANEAQQSSPATAPLSAPPQDNQASSSFLKERTKERSIPRSGDWALLTEFGSFLCWNPETRAISHRPPDKLADHTLILWRAADRPEFIVEIAGNPLTLDPLTGHLAPPAIIPPLTIIPGLNHGDIAFRLSNDAFLSAREAAAPDLPGIVDMHVPERKAWECFTPIAPAAAADFIALASAVWIIGDHPESPVTATPNGRHHFALGDHSYAIAETLPLIDPIRFPSGTISRATLYREGWQLNELRRFRPLIVFTAFDTPTDADLLRITAHALHHLGGYTGDCLVISDTPPDRVAELFPAPLRNTIHHHTIAAPPEATSPNPRPRFGASLTLPDLPTITEYQPILILDGPIIPEAPIHPTLTAILLQDAIVISHPNPDLAEPHDHQSQPQGTICAMADLPGSARTLRIARRTIRAVIRDNPDPASVPTDHAILSNAAHRLHRIDPHTLTDQIRIIPNAKSDQGAPARVGQGPFRFATVTTPDLAEARMSLQSHIRRTAASQGIAIGDLIVGMMSDREILEQFQSIGDNCEFGGVQRQLGIENLAAFIHEGVSFNFSTISCAT